MPDSARITLYDDASGLFTHDIVVRVNGTSTPFRGVWSIDPVTGDSVYNISVATPMSLCMGAGETCHVEICVDVHDLPYYCGPNDTTICFGYDLIRTGPMPTIIFPPHNSYISCVDTSIIMNIAPALSAVDPASIVLTVNGVSYTTAHAWLSFSAGEWLFFHPGAAYWKMA
jgi:hypothetical protein